MARRAVGLDIGSRYVKVVEAVREGTHARVTRWAVQEVADSSAGARAQAVARALRSANIRQRRVVCAVPRAEATVKRITLPSADRETVRKMLAFEAQQHVPFPLADVAWDFDAGAGSRPETPGKTSVLLLAARRALLNDLRAVLAQAGLRPQAISVTSVAAAAGCSQGSGESAEGDGRQAAVLIELGAGPVVVNILRSGGLHLSRPLPISGEDLTRAFASDLGCDQEHAREIRQARGMAALDGKSRRVAEWMQALRAEVERSLLAAAEGEASLDVDRVVATGGGWQTPGLVEALSSMIGVPVAAFPPQGEEVGPTMGTAVGLALQGLGLVRGANLLSAAAVGTRKAASRWVASAAAVAALVIALGLGTWRYMALQSEWLARQPAVARAMQHEREARALTEKNRKLEARLAALQRMSQQRQEFLEALKQVSEKAPQGIWLTSISFAAGRPLVAQGRAASTAVVADLLDSLGSDAALTFIRRSEKEVDFAITLQPGEGG